MYLYCYKKILKFSNEKIKKELLDNINLQSVNKFKEYIIKRYRKNKT